MEGLDGAAGPRLLGAAARLALRLFPRRGSRGIPTPTGVGSRGHEHAAVFCRVSSPIDRRIYAAYFALGGAMSRRKAFLVVAFVAAPAVVATVLPTVFSVVVHDISPYSTLPIQIHVTNIADRSYEIDRVLVERHEHGSVVFSRNLLCGDQVTCASRTMSFDPRATLHFSWDRRGSFGESAGPGRYHIGVYGPCKRDCYLTYGNAMGDEFEIGTKGGEPAPPKKPLHQPPTAAEAPTSGAGERQR